jgi:hypothetical protein
MARRYRRPTYCKHPTCSSGECRKCAWNPRSGYPAFKVSEDSVDSRGEGRIIRPAWIAMFAGIATGCAVSALYDRGAGCILFVLVVAAGLIVAIRAIVRDILHLPRQAGPLTGGPALDRRPRP